MRTAPAPNIPPIPGMCPGMVVLAGNGDGGGAGAGSGKSGKGKKGAGTGKDEHDPNGDGKEAPDPAKNPTCGTKAHPVDVITGRAFTHPFADVVLPGPLPLRFERRYSSKAHLRDVGLGYGWSHSLSWRIEPSRGRIRVWTDTGMPVDFARIEVGGERLGRWGWVLRREAWGFALDCGDGTWRIFSATFDEGRSYVLTAIDDRNKNRIALTWDAGALVEIVDSVGRVCTVEPTRDGRVGSITLRDAVGAGHSLCLVRYSYDAAGDLRAMHDADDHAARYEYDPEHRLVSDTDRTGLCFHFRYDLQGRCIESWGDYVGRPDPSLAPGLPTVLADGRSRALGIHHCRFHYYDDGYSEVVDSTQVSRFFGSTTGQLKKSVEGGTVTSTTYDAGGFVTSVTDPLGATTHYERDARGRVLKIIDPLGHQRTIERDAAGLPVRVIDKNGATTTLVRDARGNVEIAQGPMGATETLRFDERGLVRERVDAVGGRTTCKYDAQANLVELVEPGGATWRYEYDGLGRIRAETDPNGNVTRFTYSMRGDLVLVETPDGGTRSYRYDGEGHLLEQTDATGASTQWVWGGYHKRCAMRDANGHWVRALYNREGELVQVVNQRDEVHSFERDPAGRLLAEVDFDGRPFRYRLDAVGNVVGLENGAGERASMEYDPLGRMLKRELVDGDVETYSWDPMGRLVSVASSVGVFRFERDLLGRVVGEVQSLDGDEVRVGVELDPEGRRVGRTLSTGLHERIERDASGARRRTVLDDEVIAHDNDLLGNERVRSFGHGVAIRSAYDRAGQLVERSMGPRESGASPIGEPEYVGARAVAGVLTRYTYDGRADLVGIWDASRGATTLEYDRVQQLLQVGAERSAPRQYRYDATRNRYEVGAEDEFTIGDRHLVHDADEYVYDADGRPVERRVAGDADRAWRYEWNGLGLLKTVTTPDQTLVEFEYDPFARRVRKRVSDVGEGASRPISTTRYVWDGDTLAQELRRIGAGAGDPVIAERTYHFGDDHLEPLAHRDGAPEGGRWFHYVNAPNLSPDRLVDGDGKVARDLATQPWGEVASERSPATDTPLRLPGQYADEETGLVYNRWRYYDPRTGRFLNKDPVGILHQLNEYAYATNPIGFMDPLGLKPDPNNPSTFQLVDNYPPGSPESRQLRRFAGKWNEEIEKQPGGTMTRRCETEDEKRDSANYKRGLRKDQPSRFDGKVVGHVPDACAGGPSAGGPVMALDPGVNASIGGQVGGMPPNYTYNKVVVVRP